MDYRLTQPTVIMMPVKALQAYKNNPRKHSKGQIRLISESIEAFGFTNPLLVNRDDMIIAGHGRFEAAKLLGLETVPVIRLEHLGSDQIKAYVIADNRLAEQSGWDKDILANELKVLMEVDLGFDLTVTGFAQPEIDLMVLDMEERDPDDGDTIPEPPTAPVTKTGDLWKLGDHLIYCGDSLAPESYAALMGNNKAQVVFTDPPYNVPINGHVSGLGKVKHEEFAMASGEMSQQQFIRFLNNVFRNLAAHSMDGSIHFICMDWRHMGELMASASPIYNDLKNVCVWNKDNGGMGTLYRSKHEMVFVYKLGEAPYINNVGLGKHGRNRTNVWNYRGASSLHKNRKKDLELHPTVKPSRMIADALMDCSHRGGIVLDPFGGSGSTLIAAEKTERVARLVEIEPRYVDVTIRRWEELTGKKAVLSVCGFKASEV